MNDKKITPLAEKKGYSMPKPISTNHNPKPESGNTMPKPQPQTAPSTQPKKK